MPAYLVVRAAAARERAADGAPSTPAAARTTNAGLTGALYSATAGTRSAVATTTIEAAIAGANATSARRGRRSTNATRPMTSQTTSGGNACDAWFSRCTAAVSPSRVGTRLPSRSTSWLKRAKRRSSRGLLKTKLWSVGERQTSVAVPPGVHNWGPIRELGIGWPSVGLGRPWPVGAAAGAALAAPDGTGAYTGRRATWSHNVLPMPRANVPGCARIASLVAAARSSAGTVSVRSPKTRSLPEAKNVRTLTRYVL